MQRKHDTIYEKSRTLKYLLKGKDKFNPVELLQERLPINMLAFNIT